MDDEKDLAVQATSTVISKEDALMSQVLSSGNIEVLERFIALREREESRQSSLQFSKSFSEMQKEFPAVSRNNKVMSKDGKDTLYKFCPLEDILEVYAPIISKFGFSYRWSEEALKPEEKRIWCIVSGYGHEERGYVDIPIQAGNSFTNSIQQRGVSSSYGKRYSFINAFGVIIKDEDDDAMSFEEGVQYSDLIISIRNCTEKEQLKTIIQSAWKALANDQRGKEVIQKVYEEKKKELYGTKD